MARLPTAEKEEIISETRQRLLEAAIVEFARHGFANANIDRISKAAGFAKGTVYNYFPSKRKLMIAVIDEIGAQHSMYILAQVEAEEAPTLRLESFFSAGFQFVEDYPEQAQVAISVVYGHDEAFKARIYQAYHDLFALLIDDVISAGMALGEFKSGDPDLFAALMMSVYLGACSMVGPDGKVGLQSGQVADLVLDGLRQAEKEPVAPAMS
jgi:AcrR family transcriptional regulator